jgi:hypothetical protein
VRTFILCGLSCVQVAAFGRADPPSKGFYRLCQEDYETGKEARAQQRAVAIDDDDIDEMVVSAFPITGTVHYKCRLEMHRRTSDADSFKKCSTFTVMTHTHMVDTPVSNVTILPWGHRQLRQISTQQPINPIPSEQRHPHLSKI